GGGGGGSWGAGALSPLWGGGRGGGGGGAGPTNSTAKEAPGVIPREPVGPVPPHRPSPPPAGAGVRGPTRKRNGTADRRSTEMLHRTRAGRSANITPTATPAE